MHINSESGAAIVSDVPKLPVIREQLARRQQTALAQRGKVQTLDENAHRVGKEKTSSNRIKCRVLRPVSLSHAGTTLESCDG